eukprot:g3078.t1
MATASLRYLSTQGGAKGKAYTFEEAVLAGWAEDGGMILPETMPAVSEVTLRSWVLKMRPLGKEEAGVGPQLHVLELWHGPTLAFKDLGMQILVNLLKFFLGRRGERLTLLVGTSGDTGSSAIEAVRGSPLMDIVVLFPSGGRISPVQERQMTSVAAVEPNVHCIGVEGTSDDLDVPMEDVFQDVRFKHAHRAMGLPISRLCAATNTNDVLHRVLGSATGRSLDLTVAGTSVVVTTSPSMDIQIPYNIERMLYLATDGDFEEVRRTIRQFKAEGRLHLDARTRDSLARAGLTSTSVSDGTVRETIRAVWEATTKEAAASPAADRQGRKHVALPPYYLDPHTAVGVAAARRGAGSAPLLRDEEHVVCMACAHPAKFMETVAEALGVTVDRADEMVRASDKDHRHVDRVLNLRRAGPTVGSGLVHTLTENSKADWARQVRKVIEGVTRLRDVPRSRI